MALVVAGPSHQNHRDINLWQGDVTEELRAWARWCALQVADLWDCPDVVRRYLETGEGHEEAHAYTIEAMRLDQYPDTDHAAASAMWATCHGDGAGGPRTSARAARLALGYHNGDIRRDSPVIRVADSSKYTGPHAIHLSTLILRRALPSHLWGLIDSDGPNAEKVLCDALLDGVRA